MTGRRAWLAFRGSDDADDWVDNARLGRGDRHAEFSGAWAALRQSPLDAWLREVRPLVDGVVVSGHSLGGAIAVLAAEALAGEGWPVEAVVTAGGPRVGRRAFAEAYERRPSGLGSDGGPPLGAVTWRLTAPEDPVPGVPPALLGFRHVGQFAPDLRVRSASGAILADPALLRASRSLTTFSFRDFMNAAGPLYSVLPVTWVVEAAQRGRAGAAAHARNRYAEGLPGSPADRPTPFPSVRALRLDADPVRPASRSGTAAVRIALGVLAVVAVVLIGLSVWLTERWMPGATVLFLVLGGFWALMAWSERESRPPLY